MIALSYLIASSFRTPRWIVFTVYEGVSLLDLPGPLEAFRAADAFSAPSERRAKYECTVVSARGGRVMTADGVEFDTKAAHAAAKDQSIP
jgi:transcriptional regulator GlxA family with amidase domain